MIYKFKLSKYKLKTVYILLIFMTDGRSIKLYINIKEGSNYEKFL